MSDGASFWEAHWAKASPESSGRPSVALVRFVDGLPPGRSLDLGCSRGDDVVWLARQGWTALGVDVSESVLGYARANAERAGVTKTATFERHDLGSSFPEGAFDLVTATFLQSPKSPQAKPRAEGNRSATESRGIFVDFPRHAVLARGAAAVAPGGLFLSVSHGSAAPWMWAEPGHVFPSPDEELAALGLEPTDWEHVFVGATERVATGPGGQTATVIDTIVALRQR
ncbi:MAG: class I SAM-dependent methyltransferase [Myxococcales bacterium]|nr:class I SAM-dependent methyltransferase [Myxococcales bacterium]